MSARLPLALGALLVGALLAPSARADSPFEVAVTFDDLPAGGGRVELSELQDLTADLLASIAEHGVPAVGFVNEAKLYEMGEVDARIAVLEGWLAAGLELGNHTFSHPSLHDTPLEAFKEDVVRGETVTRRLLHGHQDASLRYFRHPYLRTGRDLATKLAFESFLAARGYTVAPVTLENHDYIFAALYRRALGEGDLEGAAKVGDAYVAFTFELVAFHERAARTVFGRPIRHVLLLHANRLNADRFGELAQGFKTRGYAFVTLERALEDPAYGTQDTYTGPAGVNWLFRWAQRLGVAVDWRSEPDVPAWVREDFAGR